MKKAYIVAVLLLVVLLGWAGYSQIIKPQLDNRTVAVVVPTVIDRPDISISFTYPSGEVGLSLIEPPIDTTSGTNLQNVFILMEAQDYIKYQNSSDSEETPPVISIMVFDNQADESEGGRITRMQNWAQQNAALTSFDILSAESEVVEIDGAKALHYKSAGKYNKDIYLVSHNGNMYLFVCQSESEDDYIYKSYQDLIASLLFN